jgi:hypothetical protein
MSTPLSIECPVHFRRHGHGSAKELRPGNEPDAACPPRLPRIARLMALAIRFAGLIRRGEAKD